MDYDDAIQDIISVLKQDKSVMQPWRNKASSRLEEVQAFVRMGLSTTNRQMNGNPPMEFAKPTLCICGELGTRKDCPVHGVK